MNGFNIYKFFALLVVFACYLPEIYFFMETCLFPKWYMFVFTISCGTISIATAMFRKRTVMYDKILQNISFFIIIITCIECFWVCFGIMVHGFKDSGEVGTFNNPGSLAFSLCIAISLSLQWSLRTDKRLYRLLYGVATVIFVSVLLLTRSRTGVVFLALIFVFYGVKLCYILTQKNLLRIISMTIFLFLIIVVTGFYTLSSKTDSTSGRTFILQRSMALVAENPIVGYGTKGFEREYMLRQADYFKNHPDSEYASLADEIRHPLNEFVYMWVNYGVFAPVLLLVILLLPLWVYWRHKDEKMKFFVLPMLAVLVFSCFSYPFCQPLSWLIVGLSTLYAGRTFLVKIQTHVLLPVAVLSTSLILATLTTIDAVRDHQWYQAYRYSFHHDEALDDYAKLYGYFKNEPAFLYNYAMASFKRGSLEKAESLLIDCASYWNGYNRELLLGDVYLNQNRYQMAIKHYQNAAWMCPVRFAPLEGMYKAYDALNDIKHREELVQRIATKRVKIHSADVMKIKMRCQ